MMNKVSKYKSKLIKRKKLLASGLSLEQSTDTNAILFCHLTKNNIKITLVNEKRDNVWFWSSSGKEKFKSQQKTTSLAVKNLASSLKTFLSCGMS